MIIHCIPRINKSLIAGLLTCFIVLSSCGKDTFGPQQQESFVRFYGGYLKDEGYDVKVLPDGGYVLTGMLSTEESGTNIVLIRTDKYGNELWEPRQFGSLMDDAAYSLQVLPDGGFVILGSTTKETEEGDSYTNMYMIRTTEEGELLWEKEYGGEFDEVGYNLQITSDGGFILIGSTESYGYGNKSIWLVKTDSQGDTLWTRTHGGVNDDVGMFIAETDYGYIYTGNTRSFSRNGQSNANILIVKTNFLGRVIYSYTYGGEGNDFGKSVIPLAGGGYFLLGSTVNPETNIKNIFLSLVEDDVSKPLWIKHYGGDINHAAACFKYKEDESLVITGTKEISPGNLEIFLLETDNGGTRNFIRTYGGNGLQRANAVDLTNDGGYVVTGANELGGNSMITLIKTKPGGKF